MKINRGGLKFSLPMLGCGLPLIFLVGFCASLFNEPAIESSAAKPQNVKFDGFVLPGTAIDAKAAGFTECNSDYYAATCRKHDASLMGVPAAAVISMRLNNGKTPDDLKQLTYDDIEFELPLIESIYPCTAPDSKHPFACDEDSPTRRLQEILISRGWKMKEWRGNRTFYRAAQPVVISVKQFSPGASSGVSIRMEDPEIVKAELDRMAVIQSTEKAQSAASENFKREMSGRQ